MDVLFAIAGVALALWALATARRARRRLAALDAALAAVGRRLDDVDRRLGPAPPPAHPEAPPPIAAPAEPSPAPPLPAAPPPPSPVSAPARPVGGRGWEELLVEHWLVWLGGLTLALGGVFLVKLSIDHGLLTPPVRVGLGALLGIGLAAGAEWVKRHDPMPHDPMPHDPMPHDPMPAGETGVASYVPQALAASGAATVFASIYAAFALYELLPAPVAFVLLAATAAAAVAQSLSQGPLVAALGIVGAYGVPALVGSTAPQAVPLFAYLAVVTAAALAVLRHRAWWWLAPLSLLGGVGWALVWLAGAADPEAPVVAIYLLVEAGLFVVFRHGLARVAFLAGMIDSPVVRGVVRAALWSIAVALVGLAEADRFGTTTLVTALVAIVGLMTLAWRDRRLDDSVTIAAILALALLASWALPLPVPDMALQVFRVAPDHLADFTTAAILFALLIGGGGFLVSLRAARPGRWAAPSALVPLAALVIAYWRLQIFDLHIAWTVAALALAGLNLGAAAAIAGRRDGAAEIEIEREIALAAYAVAVLGSTIVAAAFALEEAWLTVALALHLPAMGWIEQRIRLPALRWLALGVAAAILVRLVMNPYVLSYPLGPTPIVNWLLYGYGVPAAAFIAATRLFGSTRDDALVGVLEAGSAVFTLALLTLEAIHLFQGRIAAPFDDFAETGTLIALWLLFAAALLALAEARRRPVLRWGGVLVFAAATTVGMVWQPLMLVFGVRLGALPILDALLVVEAAPAALYALIAWRNPGRRVLCPLARSFAALYAFAWVSLEIQHLFHGRIALFATSGEAEWYSYSVAWLAFAGTALGWGLVRRSTWLRRAGLVGVGLVIAKVFLSDMAALSGVLRALSFIGLGGALVGLGYAYRRLLPQPPAPEDA